MNYYGQLHNDGDTVYISLVEGIYHVGDCGKARVIGLLNFTERRMIKYAKQPYDVIDLSGETLILKKYRYNLTTHKVSYDDSYVLLQRILLDVGLTAENITHLIESINRISSDKRIKVNQNCLEDYISL